MRMCSKRANKHAQHKIHGKCRIKARNVKKVKYIPPVPDRRDGTPAPTIANPRGLDRRNTPFLTDLKTQTSPIERSVMLHIVLVLRLRSLGCEPCLRTSGLFCALPWFANRVFFSLFSLPKGRKRSRRPSLSGRRLRIMVVGHFSRLEPSFQFSEPSAVCLSLGPLNYFRLLRFLAHHLFPPFRGTLSPRRPPSWSYATSGA
ncbi:hypothetical protein CsSME_00014702 [Camellia sinensis var. sinensis]